ncbi:MAG TPA: heparinase II/III family protein [Planctomycetota bacterium]|nr:heparinase II/III family protein [Planctomycetota bacterium]
MSEPLPQARTRADEIFPGPVDGAVAAFTPPAFWWLAVDGVERYRVTVEDAAGRAVIDEEVAANLLVPRVALPPGAYRWNVSAAGRARGWWSFTVPAGAPERIVPTAEAVLARVPARHPHHIHLPEDLPALVAAHPARVAALARTIDLALTRGMPPRPRFHTGDPTAPAFREALGAHRAYVDRDLVACALGHLLLRDARAGAHARASLLTILDWNPAGPCAVDGPWGDEIGLSNARCLPAVFDWIHDLLSAEERVYAIDTLVAYARQSYRRIVDERFTARPGNSHVGRLPGYLGEMALVLHGHADPSEVRRWLALALDIFGSFHPFYGDEDGGWAEGTFYATTYTKWPQPFFFALERLTGFSFFEHPFYRHVSQFFLHFAAPGWEIHPFCDGYWCLPEDEEWPGFFAQDPFGVYAERFGPEAARRLAASIPPPPVYHLHLLDVFRRPVAAATPDAAGPAANSRAFRDSGFVSMHSAIGEPARDTALLARASRYGSASHQYADQGGFAVISRGRGLITPTGYFGNSYGTRHHADWTRHTKAHNCLLVDGVGQEVRTHRTVGRIDSLHERGDLAVAALDLSGAYPQLTSYRRRLLFLRPGLILVHDELVAPTPVTCSWLAHTMSRPAIASGVMDVVREPAALRLALYGPDGRVTDCLMSDRYDVDVNDGVPEHLHARVPPQYHLAWTLPRATRLRAVAVLTVDGASARTAFASGAVTVSAGGRTLRCDLAAGATPAIVCDGVAFG